MGPQDIVRRCPGRGRPYFFTMQKHVDVLNTGADESRHSGRAIARGWRRRCPSCGGGPLFVGYLTVRHHCAACGEELYHHRADDMPAWATILIVGKVVVLAMLAIEVTWSPPVWLHWSAWPAVTLLMTLLLLPRIKGAIVGMQWALRMHGFGERE